MDSNLQHPHHRIHLKPMASGLTRYQSAPSSYLSSFLDRELCEEFLNRPSSPESIFARFLANSDSLASQSLIHPKQDPAVPEAEQVQGFYQSQSGLPPPQLPPAFLDQNSGSVMERNSLGGDGGNRNTCNLVRHSSSPPGFLANINIGMGNGYTIMRGMGDYGSAIRDASSRRMSPIAEIGSKDMAEGSTEQVGGFGVANRGNSVTSFAAGSWDDLADDDKSYSGLNESKIQGGEAGSRSLRALAHHLSLHTTSAEMASLEKIVQFQDSVPCRTRAKRGFATHPRSIAERVRRTKISERMRKLQDLVPNMDKQTNTADMLDSAVDYIRKLQEQVKGLRENRAECMCGNDTRRQ